MKNTLFAKDGNIPRSRPVTDKLGHLGGLLEVMPCVERLLDILDHDCFSHEKKKKKLHYTPLPREVIWEDGEKKETVWVLDNVLNIR